MAGGLQNQRLETELSGKDQKQAGEGDENTGIQLCQPRMRLGGALTARIHGVSARRRRTCLDLHEGFLAVVNSPRLGVCGYAGDE
jgi:hypothetical protein